MTERLRYKGRFVKKNVLDKYTRFLQSVDEKRSQKIAKESSEKEKTDDSNLKWGRRIVDIDELANNLECNVCEETLSLKKIQREQREGFQSTFTVECEKCGVLNLVETGKIHVSKEHFKYADNNTKLIFGNCFFE